nr:hypothetical protein [Tanacetum cinerariifolium]
LSPTKPDQDLSLTNRPSTPIIEDWVSDFKDESETKAPQIVTSFVQSIEQVKSPSISVQHDESETKAPQIVTSFVQSIEQVKSPSISVQHVATSIPADTPKPASPQPTSNGKRRNRKACFVCKILTQFKPVSITAISLVNVVVPKSKVTRPRHATPIVTNTNSSIRRYLTCIPSLKVSNSTPRVTAVKAAVVSAAKGMQGKWEWRPKCPVLDHVSCNTSASMTLKRFDYNDSLGRSKSVMAWVPKRI